MEAAPEGQRPQEPQVAAPEPLAPAETSKPPEPSAHSVEDDLVCTGCGYDLRRLPIDANCPECGRAIRESLHGHLLAGADPKWLRRISRGAGLLAWGWAMIVAAPLALIAATFSSLFFMHSGFGERTIVMILLLVLLGGLVGLVLIAIGAFLITIQDPRESLRESALSMRRLARVGMVGAVAAYLAIAPAGALFRITLTSKTVSIVLGLAVFVFIAVGIVALVHTVAALMKRVPHPQRAGRLNSLARALTVLLPLTVGLQVGSGIAGAFTGNADFLVFLMGCPLFVLWTVLLALSVYLAVLLFLAWGSIRRSIPQEW